MTDDVSTCERLYEVIDRLEDLTNAVSNASSHQRYFLERIAIALETLAGQRQDNDDVNDAKQLTLKETLERKRAKME